MTLITKGMGIILKGRGKSKSIKEAGKKLKKYLEKKKGKNLDFSDAKKSYKIFTK
jgi:hypothetical protein